jgi:hypothetical protein
MSSVALCCSETAGAFHLIRKRFEPGGWGSAARQASPRKTSYFFINSITARVMALTPVRIVGSGTGQNGAECREGSGTPVFWLLAMRPALLSLPATFCLTHQTI